MKLAKLDGYDYRLYTGIISIRVSSTNDPDLVDILSEISRADNRIYVEGLYLTYANKYEIIDRGDRTTIEIYVTHS